MCSDLWGMVLSGGLGKPAGLMNQPIVDEQAAPSQEMAPVMPSTPPPVSQEQGAINQAIQQINEDREAYLKKYGCKCRVVGKAMK